MNHQKTAHPGDNPPERIQGSIERVTFHSEESGYGGQKSAFAASINQPGDEAESSLGLDGESTTFAASQGERTRGLVVHGRRR